MEITSTERIMEDNGPPTQRNSGWFHMFRILTQVFLGIKKKSFFLHRVQRQAVIGVSGDYLPLILFGLPPTRVLDTAPNFAKFRPTEAGAKHPGISILVQAGLRSPRLGVAIRRASMFGNGLPGFLEFLSN
ncbi:hypothetical protein M413DRAFT_325226 [Hebeloma cylindrosporum]|uniref:Uncharacterized protein n=1 Tax=Hebeloma cylindrosporum TaxID=76867 RepID=A0A0C3BGR5_HEBCY|nr:hypothetical protein M413DRAFT_325226 [Hebeloma cylindrosporum h7]